MGDQALSLKALRAEVFKRADGSCECGCGRFIDESSGHLDHFFGRANHESLETCWALHLECDSMKTVNAPSAKKWIERYMEHCGIHGYLDAWKMALTRAATLTAKGL